MALAQTLVYVQLCAMRESHAPAKNWITREYIEKVVAEADVLFSSDLSSNSFKILKAYGKLECFLECGLLDPQEAERILFELKELDAAFALKESAPKKSKLKLMLDKVRK